MKIGDAPKPTGPSRVDGKKAAADVSKPGAVSAVDEIVLLGVPEAELTPKVRAALISLLNEVQQLRSELSEARDRVGDLEKLADRDPLLDVLNRRAFARELNRVMAMIDRYGVTASLVFIDLNDLKKINDGNGHGAGDAALEVVAETLKAMVRQTDSVGRLGGDEFGVLLLQTDQAQSEKKAQGLAEAIAAKAVDWKSGPFSISISWGAVEIVKGVSAEQAMERADSAMYEAKRKK